MGTMQKEAVPEYLCGELQWETSENMQLYQAARDGDLQNLCAALEHGANPNYFHKHEDGTPGVLHAAAMNGHTDFDAALCAKELISQGARLSAALISNRNTPIHEAATVGSEEVCKVIIEASPQSEKRPKVLEAENSFGNTALHAASRSGSVDVVRLLLEKGADPNKVNHRGSTALHIACFLAANGKDETCASSLALSDGEKQSRRCSRIVDPYLNIAAVLLCHKSLEIDIQDVNGYTALHIAAQRGCNDMVKLLVDSGSKLKTKTGIDSKGRGGRTPAGMATFGGHESTRSILDDFAAAIEDGEKIATKKMAADLEFGYSFSKPIAGSAMAVAKLRLNDK